MAAQRETCVTLLDLGGQVPRWIRAAIVRLSEIPGVRVVTWDVENATVVSGLWSITPCGSDMYVRIDNDGCGVSGLDNLFTVVTDRLPEHRIGWPGLGAFDAAEPLLMASGFFTNAAGKRRCVQTVTRTPHRYLRAPNRIILERAAASLLVGAVRRFARGESWTEREADTGPVPGLPAWFSHSVVGFDSVRRPTVGTWRSLTMIATETSHRARGYLQWFIGYRWQEGPWQRLMPGPGTFWADPFPIEHDGVMHLFFEQYRYARGLGELMVTQWHNDAWTEPVEILSESWHLSYPHIFEHEGAHYLLPEMSGGGRVDLYVSTEFPTKWRVAATLLPDVVALDSTLHFDGTRWWLFLTTACDDGGSGDLMLYSASVLTGPYEPHPQNPISRDVRVGRPAGHLYVDDDNRLIRPAQDCAVRYGRGVVLREIVALTVSEYRERTVGYTSPVWTDKIDGAHTVNRVGDLTVTDGLRWAPRSFP